MENPLDEEQNIMWQIIDLLKQQNKTHAVSYLSRINGLIELMQDKNSGVRYSAANLLVKLGTPSVAPLLACLGDEDSEVRYIAAMSLGKIGDKLALNPLIALLSDPFSDLRSKVAEALGKLGDTQAVEPLIKALQDEASYVRLDAADALRRLDDKRATQPLIQALQDKNSEVRFVAAMALGRLKAEEAIEPLIKALHDKDSHVRDEAAEALGQIGVAALPHLTKALDDKQPIMRFNVVHALSLIKDEQTIQPLFYALEDEHLNVSAKAAQALVQRGAAAVNCLLIALHSQYDWVRAHAAEALGEISDQRVIPSLIPILTDKDNDVRYSAAMALVRLKAPEGIQLILEVLHEPVHYAFSEIIEALLGLDKVATPFLLLALSDERKEVRLNAAYVMSLIKDEQAIPALIETLEDEDGDVASNAAYALVQYGATAVASLLMALTSLYSMARRNVADALGEIKDKRAVLPLMAALADPHIDVRGSAAYALGQIGDAQALPLLNNLAENGVGITSWGYSIKEMAFMAINAIKKANS